MNKLLSSRRFFATLLLAGLQTVLWAAPQTSPAGQDNQAPRTVVLPPPPAGAAAPVDSNGYIVQSPDVLKVDIWHQPDLTAFAACIPTAQSPCR